MNPLSKNFVRASLVYFFIAAILGTIMIFMKSYPAQLLFTHVHLNLLGWMSMMIFGVGYHILPRFSGTPLAYPKLGNLQFYIANIGLVGISKLSSYPSGSRNICEFTGDFRGLVCI